MIDFLFNVAINNVFISLALAIAAVIVGKTLKRPVLTHLLWLLVFVKLLIPPLVIVPALTIPSMTQTIGNVNLEFNEQQNIMSPGANDAGSTTSSSPEKGSALLSHGKQVLFILWIFGSIAIFLWSIFQAFRFNRLLKRESEIAPSEIQSIASTAASCLGIKTAPVIRMTPANISPMVWWTGRRLWLVIPAALVVGYGDDL